MALYDRTYMRPSREGGGPDLLAWGLGVTVAMYVAQAVGNWVVGSSWLEWHLGLSWKGLAAGEFWGLLTYALLHDPTNPFHLILNGLMIFWLGRMVIRDMGATRAGGLYLVGALAGGLAWLPFNPHARLIGASAAALALFAAWCSLRAEEEHTFLIWFVLPVRFKPKYFLMITLGLEVCGFLFSELMDRNGGLAYSAHLGGLLAGWAYARALYPANAWPQFRATPRISPPPWAARRPEAPVRQQRVNLPGPGDLRAEVDRILDKINAQGFGSLTPEEKRTLDQAREILRR